MSGASMTPPFPLFVGEKFAPQRPISTIPADIARDLRVAAHAGIFPSGTAFGLFCHRYREALAIRVVIRGLGNDFLFGADGSMTPDAVDVHAQVVAIAAAYNRVTADDACAPAADRLYTLEAALETDIERRQRRRRSALLGALAALWLVAGLALGIALMAGAAWQTPHGQLAAAPLASLLAPIAYLSHMAGRWTTPAGSASHPEDLA